MNLELIQSPSDFIALQEDWNNLLSSSASHVPFLRHEYLSAWWNTLGGGEWSQGDLAVLVDRTPEGNLAAIAPFFVHDQRVLLLGSFEISDYLDLIAPQARLESFISSLFSYLKEDHFPEWRVLDLYNLPEGSPTLPLIIEEAARSGFKATQEVIQPAPYLRLPGTWNDYLESLNPRYRREIEKKLTNADHYFLPVSWYIVNEEDSLDNELDAFLELMANHPQKAAFLTAKMVQQIKLSSREAFRAGWLQVAFLQVGDIKAAGYLNFDFDNKILVYNSGINPLFENLSPGWVLLGRIINWAIEQGREGLDFMRGDEPYKYQFGGINKNVVRVQISK
jgi:CelD/BcsL family acetyltransferase involved in cellulose biosynthesis